VAILDPRILTADYGPLILEALPTCQTYIDGVLQQVTGDVVGNTSATRRKGRRGRGKSLTEGSGTL
jgi:hypothetical protein